MPMSAQTRTEVSRKGGQALVAKRGRAYMAMIGSRGFWAAIGTLAERQDIPLDYRGNPFRHLLRNLKAKHK